MRKVKLISYRTDYNLYKGESYMRGFLTFKITVFGLYTYQKEIIYDVTMFGDFKAYTNYWDELISQQTEIPFRLVKNKKIFD